MTTVVFLGDSLTEGRIGASYVARVARALEGRARVVNVGINGDTVVNLRRRVARDVAPHRPDLVVVHCGLNDLGTAFGIPLHRAYYRVLKHVLIDITPQHFAMALRALVRELRLRTGAQVLLCTPTALTEQPDDAGQLLVDDYAAAVRGEAARAQLPLADLRAAFVQAIADDPRPGPPYHILTAVRDMWTVGRGRATYAELTAQRGFRLLCDGAHLAEAGADLAAEVVLAALEPLLAATAAAPPSAPAR